MGGRADGAWLKKAALATVVAVAVMYGCNSVLRSKLAPYQRVAGSASCGSNVQLLVRACAVYADDYDGRLPVASGWMDRAGTYAKPVWLRCPTVAAAGYGYALNRALSGAERGTLPNPGATAAIADSTRLERSAVDGADTRPVPGRHESMDRARGVVRGNLVGYADVHARFVPDTESGGARRP